VTPLLIVLDDTKADQIDFAGRVEEFISRVDALIQQGWKIRSVRLYSHSSTGEIWADSAVVVELEIAQHGG